MMLSDVISIIQTIFALGAFVYAYQEFKQWRVELVGSKKVEIAIRLGQTAIRVREAFKVARSPFGYVDDSIEYDTGLTLEEKRKLDLEFDFNRRLQMVIPELKHLYELAIEIEVLFDHHIDDYLTKYREKLNELEMAMIKLAEGEGTREDRRVVHSFSDDEFSNNIELITEGLLEFSKKHI